MSGEQYDEHDDISGYWEARHAEWSNTPNWGNYPYMQGWFRERFAHLLTDERGHDSSVLDYGCGCGLYTEPLLDHYDRYIGLDTSHSAIELANQYYAKHPIRQRMRFGLYQGPVGALAADLEEQVDLVISITVLQHQPVSFRLKMVEDIKRVLKPGGRYIGLEWIGGTAAYDMPPMDEEAWRAAWKPHEILFDNPPEHPDWVTNNVWYTQWR